MPESVDGAEVLDEAATLIKRHMVIEDADAHAAALWAAHTHIFNVFQHTPRLMVVAPDHECGKTLLMTHLVGNLANKPLPVDLMKAAPFFRLAEAHRPAYLIDEMDIFIRDDSDLLAAVNNGWEPHGGVARCVGEGSNMEVRIFPTFCPVAMGGIDLLSKLPATTVSRSIVIELERAAPDDIADHDIYDARRHKAAIMDTARKLARFTGDHRTRIAAHKPDLPNGIRNRMADKWSPLLAIADIAGGHWPKTARAAMVARTAATDPTRAQQLLIDAASVFKDIETAISTAELIERLCELEDSIWRDYNFKARDPENRQIQPRQLAALFKRYKIIRGTLRFGGGTAKGYKRDAIEKARDRYATPETPPEKGSQGHNPHSRAVSGESYRSHDDDDVTHRNPENPHHRAIVTL